MNKMFGVIGSTLGKLSHVLPYIEKLIPGYKKYVFQFLFNRYVGQYIVQHLSMDKLTVDILNSRGSIKDLVLSIENLNDLAEQYNLPFIFIDGYVGEITFNINWQKLFTESVFIEIFGLRVNLHLKQRDEAISVVDSMMESMSTSIQIAKECLSQAVQTDCNVNHSNTDKESVLKSDDENNISESTESIEALAHVIESIMNKIRVRFVDSEIRIESSPKSCHSGVAVNLVIKNMDFFDEADFKKENDKNLDEDQKQGKDKVNLSSVPNKKFLIDGVSIFTDEFPLTKNSDDDHSDIKPQASKKVDMENSDEFHDTLNNSTINNIESLYAENSVDIPVKSSVLLAKLYGTQELKVQFRKVDCVDGPKVKLDMNLGCLVSFISPRQLHLLFELFEGITSQETFDQAKIIRKNSRDMQKPMNQSDFKAVQREIEKHVIMPNTVQSHALNSHNGWSSPPDIIWDDDLFFPFNSESKGNATPLINSTLTDISDLGASYTSTTSSHIFANSNKKEDELNNFKIKLNSFCIIVLQDDMIIPSHDITEIITESSLREMTRKVESFFSQMMSYCHFENCYEEFLDLKNKAAGACLDSHISLIGTAITIDSAEKLNSNKWNRKSDISVGLLEIVERLNDGNLASSKKIISDLLTFRNIDPSVNQLHAQKKPKVQININQFETTQNSSRSHKASIPKVDICVILDNCLTEIDISILDRINLLINKQNVIIRKDDYIPIEKLPPSHLDNQAFFKEIMEENSKSNMKITISIEISCITAKVLFPIPDLRPLSDMNRVPWWKRNIRNEVLWVNFENFNVKSNICATYPTNFEILCNDIHIQFQETKDIPPVSILRASSIINEKGFTPVQISVKSFPAKLSNNLDDEFMPEQDDLNKSTECFSEMSEEAANLFNKRKIASRNQGTVNELTIPADEEEISKFINETLNDIQLDISINLTDVKLILPSKHIFEIIYNRVVSDLLLWTPSAPKPARLIPSLSTLIDDLSIGTTLIPDTYHYNPSPEFKPFSSMKNEDIYRSDFDNAYTSVYNQPCINTKNNITKGSSGQTLLGIQVSILNAAGSIHTPYRDDHNKIIPGKFGNVSFTFEKGFMFIASGYKGDVDAIQGCITLNTINIYHQPHNVVSYTPVLLNSDFPSTIKKLDTILHPSDFPCRIGGGSASLHRIKDCVNMCFKSNFDILKNEKIFELTGNLYCLTLKYFTTSTSENWVSQIQDMFNVEDYPVEGYTLPDCVTEINFHFEYCGIDYRPLYLPMKSYISIDSLAISSNFTAKGNSSILMFIVEDAALFLSQELGPKKVNLKNNYICVIDVGIFELCMKMDYSSLISPLTELFFSNNIIHIRTCADSCKAVMELLIYISNGGDLVEEPVTSKCDTQTNKGILKPSFTEEIAHSQCNQNAITNQRALIASMMKEAMMESESSDTPHDTLIVNKREANVDEFFFPGENLADRENANEKFQMDVETALKEASNEDFSALTNVDGNFKTSDDEFCVLDDFPGTGIQSPNGRPKARHIRHEHVSIKDNYFDPSANEYESRFVTPKHFPRPYCKYNLQEMTIVWHMYGGDDFVTGNNHDSDKNGNKFRNVRNASNSTQNSPENSNKGHRGLSVSFANGDANVIPEPNSSASQESPTTLSTSNANVKWFSVGGPNRSHDILMEIYLSKIRFKYEVYSNECPIVSRHVFIINDIEIKDRLISSKINKFLYQFSCEAFPKQASSNMIQVKAISRRCDPICMHETSLNISCRPVRLNVDQDSLNFLCNFIGHLTNIDRESEYGEEEKPYNVRQTPVMSLKSNNKLNPTNQDLYFNNSTIIEPESKPPINAPMYFRNVIFSPDVPIRIDYHGKHVDINSQYGPLAGLVIGVGHLNNSEITLKRIELKSGVLGVNKVVSSLINEWFQDIKQSQLPSIIGGVGPIHPIVKLFGGIKDLFWLPIEQYNKDGRIFRGIQRGTSAFTSSSAYAVLDLTARFVGTIQSTAETMYDMVSSGPSVKNKAYKTRKGQPKDIREGVTTAYGLVRNGLGDTASTLIKVATEEHSHKGVSGAVGGLLRQIPPSVVQPIIIASEATCTVIGGMTNQLVPDAGKEAADKWKS